MAPLDTVTFGRENGSPLSYLPTFASGPPSLRLSSFMGLKIGEDICHLPCDTSMVFPSPLKWQVNKNS